MEKTIKKYFPVFVLPTMLAFVLGFVAPFALGIYLSFCKFTTVTDARWVGISNYLKICNDKEFIHALWYTVLFTVVSVILINVLAFTVAMLLTKGIRGTNLFRTVFFMPNLIGGIILGYIWQLLLNGILAQYGKTLTYSSVYGFWGLVILVCWQQVGYMMIIYISGIQNIPGELIEAAKIDGANKRQLLRHGRSRHRLRWRRSAERARPGPGCRRLRRLRVDHAEVDPGLPGPRGPRLRPVLRLHLRLCHDARQGRHGGPRVMA